jgi:hypothetical protein
MRVYMNKGGFETRSGHSAGDHHHISLELFCKHHKPEKPAAVWLL